MSFEDTSGAGRASAGRAVVWLLALLVAGVGVVVLGPGVLGLRWTGEEPAASARAVGPKVASIPKSEPSATPERASRRTPDPLDADPWTQREWSDPPARTAESGSTGDEGSASLDCLIEPYEMVEIGSPVEGVIEIIPVDRGDSVEPGQLVAKLESKVEEAALDVARARAEAVGRIQSDEARLALGSRRRDRALKLYASNALSLDEREQIETEAKLARSELREAREAQQLAGLEYKQTIHALRRRQIRSPIAGVVVDRMMSPGEVVDEEKILKIAQLDPLRVEVILPSALFGSIRKGMRATIEPEFPGAPVHVASVKVVDPIVDAASGTFAVQLDLPNADHSIPGGLHCKVRFLSD